MLQWKKAWKLKCTKMSWFGKLRLHRQNVRNNFSTCFSKFVLQFFFGIFLESFYSLFSKKFLCFFRKEIEKTTCSWILFRKWNHHSFFDNRLLWLVIRGSIRGTGKICQKFFLRKTLYVTEGPKPPPKGPPKSAWINQPGVNKRHGPGIAKKKNC